MPDGETPFAPGRSGRGVTVRIRVKPGAGRDRIRGLVQTAEGAAIEVSVTAPPADGRANDAVVALLAKGWRLPKSSLTIVAGNKGRIKTISIDGAPSEILPRLMAWLHQLSA